MEKKYCVYVHTNKTNGKRYVGITCQKPARRWNHGNNYGGYFGNAIKKYGWDHFEHKILAEGLTKDNACYLEQTLILLWKTTDKDKGYNATGGGDGNFTVSLAGRENMSRSAKKRFENPDEIQRNRERGLKQFSTAEAIEQDRQLQLQFHENNPEAKYRRARAVNQYSLAGEYIRTWKSVTDALSEFPGSGIRRACQNGYGAKSAAGFMWRYADEVNDYSDIEAVQIDGCCRMINQYSLSGKYIRSWKGISEAEQSLHICNLSEACNGHRGKSSGYMWRFADMENRQQIEPYRDRRIKPVYQYTKEGVMVNKFDSIKLASNATGISKTNISMVCKGTNKTAGGYIWRYSNELQNKTI